MRLRNALLVFSLVLLIHPAAPAEAETALYEASLVLHAFSGGTVMPIGREATGSGTIDSAPSGMRPSGVALPQSALAVSTAAYWPVFPPDTFYWTYASFANAAGTFVAGGGPAAHKGVVNHKSERSRAGSWFIHEGVNGFGDTLGLLGRQGASAQFRITSWGVSGPVPGIFAGTSSWNMIRALGRSQMDALNPYTNTGMFVNQTGGLSDPYSNLVTTYVKYGSNTGWTTGIVTVVANQGSYSTSLQRSGYDQTPPGGARTIQLVTPALTHWVRGHGKPAYHTGHIAILKIRLVPEPAGLAMVAAGACALLLLRRRVHSISSRRDFDA